MFFRVVDTFDKLSINMIDTFDKLSINEIDTFDKLSINEIDKKLENLILLKSLMSKYFNLFKWKP